MTEKNIVILSVSVGEGHNQVSHALQEEWQERGYHAQIIDIFDFMKNSRSNYTKKAYFYMIYTFQALWEAAYRMTNNHILPNLLRPFIALFWKDLINYCKGNNFEIMITTHPLATQIGIAMKKQLKNSFNLFAVLSDFSTHGMSISKDLDALFVATKNELYKIRRVLSEASVYFYGIPLRKTWDDCLSKEQLRKKLQLPLHQQVIVISGGGEGIVAQKKLLSILEKDSQSSHIVWFLGKSKGRETYGRKLDNGSILQFVPFSTAYPDYMKAADLLISKPGGVTMAEAIRVGIPTGMFSPLPGQEKVNQQVLLEYANLSPISDNTILSTLVTELKGSTEASEAMKDARKNIVGKIIELSKISPIKTSSKNTRKGDRKRFLSLIRKKQRSS